MAKRLCIRIVAILLLGGLVFGLPPVAMATAVDRTLLCNLEGHPGEIIEAQITLQGTDAEGRSGYWYTYYNKVEGDDERMDITSWITIEPEEYTIKLGESIVFTVRVKVPGDATPGLWGAASKEADQKGHSAERRTYIIFKDTISGGNVYSGMLIPVSVVVLEEASLAVPLEQPSPSVPALNFIKDNVVAVVFGVIIVILLAVLLTRGRAKKTG